MKKAISLALQKMKEGHGGPFGALIVRDRKIIAEGYNAVTSLNDPTAHAEVQAIRSACKAIGHFELQDCEIYTSCEPCPMCLGALYWARIKKVYFSCTREDAAKAGFDDEFIYKEIALWSRSHPSSRLRAVAQPVHKRSIPLTQVLNEHGLTVFDAWDRKTNKICY